MRISHFCSSKRYQWPPDICSPWIPYPPDTLHPRLRYLPDTLPPGYPTPKEDMGPEIPFRPPPVPPRNMTQRHPTPRKDMGPVTRKGPGTSDTPTPTDQILFVGPLIPVFWTSGDVSSRFQSQSGQPYSHLVEVYVLYVSWESHLVQHLLTSSVLFHVPAIPVRFLLFVGEILNLNVTAISVSVV